MKVIHNIAATASRKLKRLFHTITFKRNIPAGYIRLPSTDSISPEQQLLQEQPFIDLSLPFAQINTSDYTNLTPEQWTNFRPFADIYTLPFDHPAWGEAPYVRDAPNPSMQQPRRWSHPVHIDAGGAMAKLLALLDQRDAQGWNVVGPEKKVAKKDTTIKEQTDIINDIFESRADFRRGYWMTRFIKTWQSFAATKKDSRAMHMRLTKREKVVAEKQVRIEELVENLEKAEEMAAAKQARTEELVKCLDKAIGILETVYERYGSVEPFALGEDELLRVAFGAVEDGETGDSDGDDMS